MSMSEPQKTVRITTEPGIYSYEWCPKCLVTHAVAPVYALDGVDPTTAAPIGEWSDCRERFIEESE